MIERSGQTTANEPVGGVDPGGTHKAPGSGTDKSGQGARPAAQPHVESSDQNDNIRRNTDGS